MLGELFFIYLFLGRVGPASRVGTRSGAGRVLGPRAVKSYTLNPKS